MPVVAVVNRKGGSGKSTLATHLAVYCAKSGFPVMLGDTDRNLSTQVWLRLRQARRLPPSAPIVGRVVDPRNVLRTPAGTEHVVLDTPGGLHGFQLGRVVCHADAVIIPVCSSVFDRDSAAECWAELRRLPRVTSGRCKVAVVGMRLDARTKAAEMIKNWAEAQGMPFIGVLRETQAYVRSIEHGLTVFDLLTNPAIELAQVTRATAVENLWLVPSWKEMAEFPTRAGSDPERAKILARVLAPADERYDVIIFDAPPSFGLVTTNVLLAAEEIVIPVATTYLALDGCAEMVATVERVAQEYGHTKLRVTQIIPTLHRKTQMSEEIVEKLKQYFPQKVSEPMGFNVAIDEAQSHGKTIWEHAPWSRGATLLQAIAERIERAK